MTEPSEITGTAVELLDRAPSFLSNQEPVWMSLNEAQRKLLRMMTDGKLTDAELAQGVELAAAYGLDPYAKEIHFGKSKGGKLMILTGRDGLRKIVQRNGCELECDTVYANDTFSYFLARSPQDLIENGVIVAGGDQDAAERAFATLGGGRPFHYVKHVVPGFARGALLGAWARVYERRTNIERGWFPAALGDYDPGNVSYDTPWKRQKPVMILAAAERQAARQSMPLGGLLIEGEDDVINANVTESPALGSGAPRAEIEMGWGDLHQDDVDAIEAVLADARSAGHTGLANRGNAQGALVGQPHDAVKRWIERAREELARNGAKQKPVEPHEFWGHLPPDVIGEIEAVMQRAEGTGYDGFADRDSVRAAVGGDADAGRRFVLSAKGTLDRWERERLEKPESTTPVDPEVVESRPLRPDEGITNLPVEEPGEAPFDARESALIDALEDAAERGDAEALTRLEGELIDLRNERDGQDPADTLPGL